MRTDVWWWSEAKGEVLDEAGATVARVVSDSAADPGNGDGPIMAAGRDLLQALEAFVERATYDGPSGIWTMQSSSDGAIHSAREAIAKARL